MDHIFGSDSSSEDNDPQFKHVIAPVSHPANNIFQVIQGLHINSHESTYYTSIAHAWSILKPYWGCNNTTSGEERIRKSEFDSFLQKESVIYREILFVPSAKTFMCHTY